MRYLLLMGALSLWAIGTDSPAMALNTAPKFQKASDALVRAAEAAVSDGDLDRAQLRYEQALVANPSSLPAMMGLGRTHADAGRNEAALRFYEMALAIDPSNVVALKGKADMHLALGDVSAAREALGRLDKLCEKTGTCQERNDVRQALKAIDENPGG